jgi:hypothetical protein
MITALLILGCILLIISLLLIAPVNIHIDTDNQYYSINIPVLVSIRLEVSEHGRRLRNKIFFIPFSVSFDKRGDNGKESAIKARTDHKAWYFSYTKVSPGVLRFYLKNAIELIRSFRFKRISIEMDTGDFTLNARLIPVILIARRQNIDISVNFIDNNSLVLIVQNRIYRLLWQAIKFYFNYRKFK